MKILFHALLLLIIQQGHAQQPVSGSYDELKLAYNPANNLLTGYFESGTGDAGHGKNPQFACAFYLEGKLVNGKATIKTYSTGNHPDTITGTLQIDRTGKITIRLPEEHGGCWNVQHFADTTDPAIFVLSKKENWIEIHMVTSGKAFFAGSPFRRAGKGDTAGNNHKIESLKQ